MCSQSLRWHSLMILLMVHFSYEETMPSTTMANDHQSFKSANLSQVRNTSNEQEWRSNDSIDHTSLPDKIYSIDLATFHKYRRNGVDNNLPELGSANQQRRYFPPFPEPIRLNEFENDFYYQQQRDKNRYNDEVYPVRTQNCAQYLRDVNRFQNDGSTVTQGILQGWIGGRPRWQGKHSDDKRQGSSPSYVPITTATAKVPASQNRYPENNNPRKYNSYDRAASVPVKTSLYDSEYRTQNSQDYYSADANRDYNQDRTTQWTQPLPSPQRDRNRIIYYEYNLDDFRRPTPGISHQYQGEYDRNCGSSFGFSPCASSEVYIKPNRPPYDDRYNREYSRGYGSAQSKSASAIDYEDNEAPFSGSFNEDRLTHRFRNVDRGQRRQGYVYSLDLPRERQRIPGSSPSIYMSQFPFANSQFLNEDTKYETSSKSSHFAPITFKK